MKMFIFLGNTLNNIPFNSYHLQRLRIEVADIFL